ncbi:hypothetical protein [Achromobacter spanius]|uniref:hypothetical protein n=1 Tax=Achromobacter spanius TaxID=217203 RepID=UPI00131A2E58|nr:hypothetical protein [Achromobacter spanius]
MNSLKFAVALLAALPFTSLAEYAIPSNAELFMREMTGRPMTVKKGNYAFTIENASSTRGKAIEAKLMGKSILKITNDDPNLENTERLFAVESHGCNENTIDLVIQTGPRKNDDIITRSYYRYVFSIDLKSIVAEFYDPSVLALNAVLPIQTVEGIPSPEDGKKIVCKDDIPVVVSLPEGR